jgi:hypothetical protein
MNFAALDLNLLRVDATMRGRSVTRAGEQIGLSQLAASAALNRCFPLDDRLFGRCGNKLPPMPQAADLAEPVREAMGNFERTALLGDGAGSGPCRMIAALPRPIADAFAACLGLACYEDRIAGGSHALAPPTRWQSRTPMAPGANRGDIAGSRYSGRRLRLHGRQLLLRLA